MWEIDPNDTDSVQMKAQKNKSTMTNDFLKSTGFYVDYHIFPIKKNVQFSLITDKVVFENLLRQYGGKKIEEQMHPHEFGQNLPITAYQEIVKSQRYLLSNGYWAVDRSATHKSIPFLICRNREDYKTIIRFLGMVPYPTNDLTKEFRPLILCFVEGDQNIKTFLRDNKSQLTYLKKESDESHNLYKTSDGKIVQATYAGSKSTTPKGEVSDDHKYFGVIIYSSFKEMKAFTREDYEEVDETNFKDYTTRLLYDETNVVKVKVLNAQNLDKNKKKSAVKQVLGKWNENFTNTVELSDSTVIAQYSEYIYLRFNNIQDFLLADPIMRNGATANADPAQLEKIWNEEGQKIANIDSVRKEIYEFLSIELPETPTGVAAELKKFDSAINRYFFDTKFINRFYSSFVAVVGDIVIRNGGGKWVYNERYKRYIIELPNKKILDFSPYLFEEMLNQRYTNSCSTESIISGLTAGLNFEVAPSRLK